MPLATHSNTHYYVFMIMDVVALREFYASRLGEAAVASVSASISAMWHQSHGERFMGLGYPVPWLERFSPDCERTICMMPAAQGALQWPSSQNPATALTYDDELPLRDGSVDRILMVHFLEHALMFGRMHFILHLPAEISC